MDLRIGYGDSHVVDGSNGNSFSFAVIRAIRAGRINRIYNWYEPDVGELIFTGEDIEVDKDWCALFWKSDFHLYFIVGNLILATGQLWKHLMYLIDRSLADIHL